VNRIKISDSLKRLAVEKNAASLGRIYQHIENGDIQSWSIQTSFRKNPHGVDPEDYKAVYAENFRVFSIFKKEIRSLGLGYIPMIGYGQEEDPKSPERKFIQTKELSLFIPKMTFDNAKKYAKKYNQDAFVYAGPEVKCRIGLFSGKGNILGSMNNFNPKKISDFFSMVKGKPFHFSSIIADTMLEAQLQAMEHKRIEAAIQEDIISAFLED